MLNIRSTLLILCLILLFSFTEELKVSNKKQVCRPFKRKCILDSDCCNSLMCINEKCQFPPKIQEVSTTTDTSN